MSAMEAKVRCPKCHGRFFVPLAEIGRDGTTPCPNCGTSIHVKAKADPAVPGAQQPAAEQGSGPAASPAAKPTAVATPVAAGANAAAPAPPWWKFWARQRS